MNWYKLSKAQLSEAVKVYARKYGWSAASVRGCTRLQIAACDEYRNNRAKEMQARTEGGAQ